MYILSLVNKETIWGSTELVEYGADPALQHVGSLYTLAGNKELTCAVLNGKDAGKTLYEVFSAQPEIFGYKKGENFPLIISFINAGADLSIQIHPDDAYARRVENKPFGKCESWIFFRAPVKGSIAMGCKCATKAQMEALVAQGRWNDVVDELPVKEDDYVFVTPGTLHALTTGSIAYEIQQATDITYRFYDYDRVDASGNKRPLQLKQAMDVVDATRKSYAVPYGTAPHRESVYETQRIALEGSFTNDAPVFACLTLLDGALTTADGVVKKGSSILVMPGETVAFTGKADAIRAIPVRR